MLNFHEIETLTDVISQITFDNLRGQKIGFIPQARKLSCISMSVKVSMSAGQATSRETRSSRSIFNLASHLLPPYHSSCAKRQIHMYGITSIVTRNERAFFKLNVSCLSKHCSLFTIITSASVQYITCRILYCIYSHPQFQYISTTKAMLTMQLVSMTMASNLASYAKRFFFHFLEFLKMLLLYQLLRPFTCTNATTILLMQVSISTCRLSKHISSI